MSQSVFVGVEEGGAGEGTVGGGVMWLQHKQA